MLYQLSKFNNLCNLILEANNPFPSKDGEFLPSQYLTIPSIKQCLIHKHLFHQIIWRDSKQFQYIKSADVIKNYTFKNIQLALEQIFKNKQLLEKINENEYLQNSIEFIISTDQFALLKNLHLILILKVNSKSDINDNNKYYTCFITSFCKNDEEFEIFKKQGYKSLNHPEQIPVHIIGESIDSFIASSLSKI